MKITNRYISFTNYEKKLIENEFQNVKLAEAVYYLLVYDYIRDDKFCTNKRRYERLLRRYPNVSRRTFMNIINRLIKIGLAEKFEMNLKTTFGVRAVRPEKPQLSNEERLENIKKMEAERIETINKTTEELIQATGCCAAVAESVRQTVAMNMHKINKNCVNYILAIIKNTVIEPVKRAVNKVKNTVQKSVSKVHGGSLSECNYDKNGNLKKFNNFKPREYDYEDLERKLLGWDDDLD